MYAEITAVLEPRPDPRPAVQFVCRLAQEMRAKLVGLYLHGSEISAFELFIKRKKSMLAARDALIEEASLATQAEMAFGELAHAANVDGTWRELDDRNPSHIARHARYSDLIVLGGQGTTGKFQVAPVGIAKVIMESGRPALVLPSIPPASVRFPRILICWNASREASRAVHDALPFLHRAERVVVAIAAENSLYGEEDEPALDIGKHLLLHGINAVVERLSASGEDAGSLLLSRAADLGANLIVAGCYGHMRLAEFVFGGVSWSLLRDCQTPLLMSH